MQLQKACCNIVTRMKSASEGWERWLKAKAATVSR